MSSEPKPISDPRSAQLMMIGIAAREAVRDALRRHMLLGESVAVADDSVGGGVKLLGPDEIRQALKAA